MSPQNGQLTRQYAEITLANISALLQPGEQLMSTYYIDPSSTSLGNGTIQDPFNSWSQVTWQSGSTYLQEDNTIYAGTVDVFGSNISIGSYGSGMAPQTGGFYFSGATNVGVSNYTISGNSIADVVFANEASGNSVRSSDISGAPVGVLFATGAGAGNTVYGSTVHNTVFGVDLARGTLGEYVTNDIISNNNGNGVELEGDSSTVSFNDLTGNGTTVPGSSAIHTYTTGPSVDGGNNNIIEFNIVSGTHDDGYGDGNGVEIDQWTHGNLVGGNILYDNDGAGAVVYGSYSNEVISNVSFSNEQGNPLDHGIHGEIDLTSGIGDNDPTYSNVVGNNIMSATTADAVNLYVDPSSSSGESIGTNFFGSPTGNLTTTQLSAATDMWYTWWATQGVPTSLQTLGHSVLEGMVTF
jgi:Right handed beta helix region